MEGECRMLRTEHEILIKYLAVREYLADMGVTTLIKTECEVVDWIRPIQVKVNMVDSCVEGNDFLGSTESVVSWPAE
jgi:hypothetical protein